MADRPRAKGFREAFAKFFESPTREALRDVLRDYVGEFDDFELKGEMLPFDRIVKHMLGMANKSGGVIIFGVSIDENGNLDTKGLDSIADRTEFSKGLDKYAPHDMTWDVIDFHYEDSEYARLRGRSFRVIVIEYSPEYIPFLPKKGSEEFEVTDIFTRRNASTIRANYEQLQHILNRRIETDYSSTTRLSLREHVEELKELYAVLSGGPPVSLTEALARMYRVQMPRSPCYPKETFGEFIAKMIESKKRAIASLVNRS